MATGRLSIACRIRGNVTHPPELDRPLPLANRGRDQLVVTKLDRLGRSLEHLIELSRLLRARGVDLMVPACVPHAQARCP